MAFYAYIVASKRNGTLYIGSTDSLTRRIWEHREGIRPGFTKTHGVTILVWFEVFDTRAGAFRRERQMKEWKRLWKLRLIERINPGWRDLYDDLV
ncbi:MAG: GIY-YIG nuclease family protein [Pseudomonadota bacterium]